MKTLVGMFVAAIAAGWALTAAAAPPSTICGPSGSASQSFCITPNADGSIDVSGGTGGGDVNITEVGGNAVTTTLPTADATVATDIGALGSSTCATDTGSCNVNAKLSRIAERLTALIASLVSEITIAASSSSTVGVAPVVTSALGSNKVIKASAGNLYGFTVTTGATAGYIMVFNATALPSNGAVTPVDCFKIAANETKGVAYPTPLYLSTGATIGFSSDTDGCLDLTASTTAFISGQAK